MSIEAVQQYIHPKDIAKSQGKPQIIIECKEEEIKARLCQCSWCHRVARHFRTLVHRGPRRSEYCCSNCYKSTVKCRWTGCVDMARAHPGWKEDFCFNHTRNYKHETYQGYCSWCFENSTHLLLMENFLTKVVPMMHKTYSCENCMKTTKKCRRCKTNMARVGPLAATNNCYICCGLVTQQLSQDSAFQQTSRSAWCPWCITSTTHILQDHFAKKVRKDVYQCLKCMNKTKICAKCDRSMVKDSHRSSVCSLCKHNRDENYWLSLQEKFGSQILYYQQAGFLDQLQRQSKYRKEARKAGLLNPFLLLVTMHPEMRRAVALKLSLQTIKMKNAGDPHFEAHYILFHKKKGIRRRSDSTNQNMHLRSRANWYQIVRRAICDVAGFSTFQPLNREVYEECLSPPNVLINDLEIELLEVVSLRQLHMLPLPVVYKARELYQDPQIFSQFEFARNEGMISEAIYIVFIGIIITQNLSDIEDVQQIQSIQSAQFIDFLNGFIQGKNPSSQHLENVENAGYSAAAFATKAIITTTLAELVTIFLFPPLALAIQIGSWLSSIPAIAGFFNKGSREISCPAVILIVLQKFLLSTSQQLQL